MNAITKSTARRNRPTFSVNGGVPAKLALAASLLLALCPPLAAHELWLEPTSYHPAAGTPVGIIQRSGSDFAGLSYPYLSDDTQRFSIIGPAGEIAIKSIEGDDPSAEVSFKRPGLTRVLYHGAINEVVFETFETFATAVNHENNGHILPLHRAQGKPETGIREKYFRCAKTLIAVGDGKGEDTPIGLPIELIAEANPYTLKPGTPLPVRLLYEGKPLAGATVKVFNHDTPAKPTLLTSDAAGRVLVELPKPGEYMIHSVYIREPRPNEQADWFSLWASLTFYRP